MEVNVGKIADGLKVGNPDLFEISWDGVIPAYTQLV